MYPYFLVGLNSIYKQTGWSVLECPYCRTFEALRVEQRFLVVSLFFMRLAKIPREKTLRCDFCERRLGLAADTVTVSLDEWGREDGLSLLLRQVLPELDIRPPERITENRMLTLLDSIAETTSLTNMHVSSTALVVGGLLSLPMSIPFALFLHSQGFELKYFDKVGFVVLCGIIGFAIGAIVAGAIHGVPKAQTVALNRILLAYSKYDVDMRRIEQLSHDYPQRVQNVVSKACQEISLSQGE